MDLGRREAEEGARLSLGVAEEAEVPQVPPLEQGEHLAPPFWEERG